MTPEQIAALTHENRLEWFERLGTIDAHEFLLREYPRPRFTFEELEAMGWQPYSFENGDIRE